MSQGIVLGSFYIGYTLTQIPGAILARIYGGRLVFGLGMMGAAVCTLLTPLSAFSVPLLCTVRALMGIFEGVAYPAQVLCCAQHAKK
jgi:MFS family permease